MENDKIFSETDKIDLATKDPASYAELIGKLWEDRNQFEEAVQQLLKEYNENKPRDIFY